MYLYLSKGNVTARSVPFVHVVFSGKTDPTMKKIHHMMKIIIDQK